MSLAYFSHPPHNIDKRLSPVPEATMTNMQVGLWTARLGSRLTQRELAHRAGIARKTVSELETGKSWPTLIVALKLAKVLERPVEELFRLTK
jgi:putative transcriptional regulator